MKHAILAVLLFGGMLAAADDAASKKMLKELEGSYSAVAAEKAGKAPPTGFIESMEKIAIKGNTLSISFKAKGDAKGEEKSATIIVDAAKSPAHIDMKPNDGPKKDETMLGIVMIDGDTVTICYGDSPKASRPTEFKTTNENKCFMITIKKMKQ